MYVLSVQTLVFVAFRFSLSIHSLIFIEASFVFLNRLVRGCCVCHPPSPRGLWLTSAMLSLPLSWPPYGSLVGHFTLNVLSIISARLA